MKAIIILIIIIILNFSDIFANLFVEEQNNGVIIKISGLLPEVEVIDQKEVLSISNLKSYESVLSTDYKKYIFNIAIPNDMYKLEYKVISEIAYKNDHITKNYLNDNYKVIAYKIQRIRGIEVLSVEFIPFRLDKSKNQIYFVDSIEIKINFSTSLALSNRNIGKESIFFADILNQKHINSLLINRKLSNNDSNLKLQSSDWYNNNIDYIKIETVNDEITKIQVSTLIGLLPQLAGKNSKYLHLIHNGKPLPYFIPNDDGIISINDILIFEGKRPIGDTTWYDNYTKYEPFYIYYDESKESSQYSLMEELIPDNITLSESVSINEHIEEEKFYGIGTEFMSYYYDGSVLYSNYNDSRTVQSEGWYWAQIVPFGFNKIYNQDKFIKLLNLYPSDNPNEKLNISVRYLTNQDSIYRQPLFLNVLTYFDLNFSVNGNLIKRDSLTGYHKRDFTFSGSNESLVAGLNNIMLESKQVYTETNERTNIDFIEISGKSKPIAFNNQLRFIGNSQDMRIKTGGFTSNSIYAFDTENNKLKILNSNIRGFQFTVSGISGANPSMAVGISDSLISSYKHGIEVLVYNFSTNSYIAKSFSGANNDHNSYINSLADGTPIAITVVLNSDNTNFSSLRSLGSKIIDQYKAGRVYIGAFIKSRTQSAEKIGEKSASITDFLEHSQGINYNYDIALKSNNLSKFNIVGQSAINEISKISKVNKSNLKQKVDVVDAVFISHNEFLLKTEILAEYRRKSQNVKIDVIDVEDIYKEFNYGKKSPHAIKEYLKFRFENSGLTHVLLVGDASWDSRQKLPVSLSKDWLPTYGYPASDWWYACLDGEDDVKSEIIIGRIPANNNTQLQDYIDKAIEYDTTAAQPWMKNFLFLIGGYTSREINSFSSLINSHYSNEILNPDLCGSIDKVVKDVTGASTSSQGGEIREKINKGALWTIYIGHAAAEIFDLDGWSVNSLNNKGRYGILTTVSCNTGAFAEPELIACRNEQYIFEPNKGYIATTGSTFTGFVGEHNSIATRMVEALSNPQMKMRRIGDLMFYGKSNLSRVTLGQMITVNTFSLLGDPLVKVRLGTEPDAYIQNTDLSLTNQNGIERFVVEDDFVNIDCKINNYGYSISADIPVRIVREYNNQKETQNLMLNGLCLSNSISTQFYINQMPGRHKFTIIIDPDNVIEELDKSNNILVRSIDVFEAGILSLDPLTYWDFRADLPHFRFINPFEEEFDFDYQFIIGKSNDTNNVLFFADSKSDADYIDITDEYIDWKPDFVLSEGSYWLHSRYINRTQDIWSAWQSIPVNAVSNFNSSVVNAKIQSKIEFELGKSENLTIQSNDNKTTLFLKRDTIEFHALSVKGNLPNNQQGYPVVEPHINIEVGGQVFLDGPHDLGFNVVTIRLEDGKFITRQKRFETWGLDLKYPADEHFRDSLTPIRLVEFLRDSVRDDEYLIVATCKSSFRLPRIYKLLGDPGNIGSVDTLLYYLKQFGSKIADTLKIDSINNGDHISFAMMGWRGAALGSIPESISMIGDSAKISGNLISFLKNGSYKSKSINKAKKWNSIFIESAYHNKNEVITAFIKGINQTTNQLDLIKTVVNPDIVNISDIDANIYNELSIDFTFSQNDTSYRQLMNTPSNTINSITFDFVPADEIAIKKRKTFFEKEASLRGYDVEFTTEIINLSLRTRIDSSLLRLNVMRSGSENDYRNIIIPKLEPNESHKINYTINTDILDYNNSLAINIDPNEQLSEFYRFNNNHILALNTIKDTLKPNIQLRIDGKVHQNNDYISMLPYFEIDLFDNSPLQITDSLKISVRINGYLHPFQRTLWSKFETINDGSNLKARFSFRPDTLQFEDVSIIIYIADNEGNRDTITTYARVSLVNAFIEDVFTYPNPSREELNFNVVYKAPLPGAELNIGIFDMSGNMIDEISYDLLLGINSIPWTGRFNGFNSISSGVYFYRIRVSGDYFIEPFYGKFIKVN